MGFEGHLARMFMIAQLLRCLLTGRHRSLDAVCKVAARPEHRSHMPETLCGKFVHLKDAFGLTVSSRLICCRDSSQPSYADRAASWNLRHA
jgi:hypothetical protein